MGKNTDPRHEARAIALQQLFLNDFHNNETLETGDFEIKDLAFANQADKYNEGMVYKIVKGVLSNKSKIDDIITTHAPAWPLEKIRKVDLQILRIAIYEGFIEKITPPKVAIDEAIELAKEFSGDTSNKFVNGVLGALYENLKDK